MMAEAKRVFPYVSVDVFTAKALEGNQLAVYTDARGFREPELQQVAKEMNLSETTFVFPREAEVEREQGVKVRIFTVDEELPFAGHPTLGTAFVLRRMRAGGAAREGAGGADEIVLELKAGKIPVRFTRDGDGREFGEMRQRDPEMGATHDREALARALGLEADDFDDSLPIQTVSTGMAFAIAPFRSLATLQNLKLQWNRLEEYLARTDAKFLYMVSRETVDATATLHARMIFYNGEDPATGSAAGCAAAWMRQHGVSGDGERKLIEQGMETRRPSRMWVSARQEGDRIVDVKVGGNAVEVARGDLAL